MFNCFSDYLLLTPSFFFGRKSNCTRHKTLLLVYYPRIGIERLTNSSVTCTTPLNKSIVPLDVRPLLPHQPGAHVCPFLPLCHTHTHSLSPPSSPRFQPCPPPPFFSKPFSFFKIRAFLFKGNYEVTVSVENTRSSVEMKSSVIAIDKEVNISISSPKANSITAGTRYEKTLSHRLSVKSRTLIVPGFSAYSPSATPLGSR